MARQRRRRPARARGAHRRPALDGAPGALHPRPRRRPRRPVRRRDIAGEPRRAALDPPGVAAGLGVRARSAAARSRLLRGHLALGCGHAGAERAGPRRPMARGRWARRELHTVPVGPALVFAALAGPRSAPCAGVAATGRDPRAPRRRGDSGRRAGAGARARSPSPSPSLRARADAGRADTAGSFTARGRRRRSAATSRPTTTSSSTPSTRTRSPASSATSARGRR